MNSFANAFQTANDDTATYITQMRTRAKRAQEVLVKVRRQAQSPDKSVTVEVDATGRLTSIKLSAHALKYGAERLASVIEKTNQRAQTEAAKAVEKVHDQLREDPRLAEALQNLNNEINPDYNVNQ